MNEKEKTALAYNVGAVLGIVFAIGCRVIASDLRGWLHQRRELSGAGPRTSS